jgi:threonine dehydrogenase-like Zn-dependent dehydrogenase
MRAFGRAPKAAVKGGTMKGVAFPGDRLVSYVDVPDPNPGPLDVIVEMKASGMCGTDLQNYRRPRDQAPYMPSLIGRPPIAGHEPAGIVCAVGAAVLPGQARVGERVMCITIRAAQHATVAAAAGSSFVKSRSRWCASTATTTMAGTRHI